ncbi:IS6 family transposase [Deinococcus sp. Arct2-2]|uniref:IS6 family transposase n=1 Tax=Deinococcus sp. Arct2-2 TaxID=2568653 RepID=UPI0010A315A8|nr:IS6 family transposase [Deinococcus sp. Arct2-2]THF70901.1 IS6 family transposase [Deinococcus sp. Arct2-2]
MTDHQPSRHRFPISIIQQAVWLSHHCPLSSRDVQDLLQERGVEVSHDTLREWNITFSPWFADHLRHRDPRPCSRWHMDEVCTTVGGVRHWLWRAVDEHGVVLEVLRQRHRDPEAARPFLIRLLGEFHVPETICTDQLARYGAAIRERPALQAVDHQQVIRAARCTTLTLHSHRPTRQHERGQLGFRKIKRTQAFLKLHARVTTLQRHTRTTVPAQIRRSHPHQAVQMWREVGAGGACHPQD